MEITNEQLAALRTALGLADDADLSAITDAAKAIGDQLPTLREALGLAEDATIDDIVKAVKDKPADDGAPTDGQPAAASTKLPQGVVAVDAGRLATLEANSARFAEHLENERRAGVEKTLNAAISEGRITPAHKESWRKSFEANADQARDLLATLAPNSAVPVSELGHATEPADNNDVRDSAAYKGLEG